MALQLAFAARSDVGKVRSKNDDSAYVGRYLAVVADGMGGHVGGDVASASTVLDLAPLDRADHADPATVLADEIQSANQILNELVHHNPKLARMGTTCTAVLVDENQLHVAHIGDSRAYRLKDGVFEQLTTDHTFVQRLIDEGRLKPEDAENHPHKNVLMRVLGDVDASPELDVATYPAEPGERWILCSDGLMAVVDDATIEEIMRTGENLDAIVNQLVELTLDGGSPDNVTIVAFETEERDNSTVADVVPNYITTAEEAEQLSAADENGHVSASLLRQDLSARPHFLVGAAQLATDTDQIPIVTRSSTQRRAANLLHGGPAVAVQATSSSTAVAQDVDDADDEPLAPRGRNWPFFAVIGIITVLLIAGATLSTLWVRGQYYVGVHNNEVAIFRGVSQNLGPIELSTVEDTTDIPVSRLPGYTRKRVESGLPAQDLNHAHDILIDLREALTPEAPPVTDGGNAPDVTLEQSGSASASIGGATGGAIGGGR